MVNLDKDEFLDNPEVAFEEFVDFFETDYLVFPYKEQLKSINSKNEYFVNIDDILQYNKKLFNWIIKSPDEAITLCSNIIQNKITPINRDIHYFVSFYSESNLLLVPIRKLRKNHIDKLVTIRGIVTKASPVKPKLTDAAFECPMCGNIMIVPQTSDKLSQPKDCSSPNCQNKKDFIIRTDDSEFTNVLSIGVQEPPVELKPGEVPYITTVYLYENLVDFSIVGQIVKITGIYRSQPAETKNGIKKTICDTFIIANNVKTDIIQTSDDLTEEEKKEILELAKSKDKDGKLNIYDRLITSFAPHIIGNENLKMACLLSLFGGVEQIIDGGALRGLIHVLFMGDPSTAKSQLLKFAHLISPRAIYTTGVGTSTAGLTAAVTQDVTGGWTLEAGALPQSSGGHCIIDEFDKMNDCDRGGIHEVMEQQTTSISKAGIITSLPAKTSIIAAANPISGKYDEYKSIQRNINLPYPITSRFDLIFIVKDTANEQTDRKIARQILKNHYGIKSERPEGIISPDILKKYVLFARNNFKPMISENLAQKIEDFYVEVRNKNPNIMTARNIEGVIRLCEAHAKIAFQTDVKEENVDYILGLVKDTLKDLGYDSTSGNVDIEQILTGYSKEDHQNAEYIYDEIVTLIEGKPDNSKNVAFMEILNKYSHDYSREKMNIIFKILLKQKLLKKDSNNKYQLNDETRREW